MEPGTDGTVPGESAEGGSLPKEPVGDPTSGALPVELEELDGRALGRWAVRARDALAEHRLGIDSLNVFPVPDGDTGTNMLHTLSGALRSLRDSRGAQSSVRLEGIARASLWSARGNSGVILGELIRGMAQGVASARGRIDGPALARALRVASERAWTAVGRPVEGTMLSVAAAAAAAADRCAAAGGRLAEVSAAAVEGAHAALAATPEQLPVLKRAGVVDAGGAGLVVVLTALHEVITGRSATAVLPKVGSGESSADASASGATDPFGSAGPSTCVGRGAADDSGAPWASPSTHEVMYVVTGVTEAARDQLAAELALIGDSLVIAGDAGIAHVHVHTTADAVADALAAGGRAGRLEHPRVEDLSGPPRAPDDDSADSDSAYEVSAAACMTAGSLPETDRRVGPAETGLVLALSRPLPADLLTGGELLAPADLPPAVADSPQASGPADPGGRPVAVILLTDLLLPATVPPATLPPAAAADAGDRAGDQTGTAARAAVDEGAAAGPHAGAAAQSDAQAGDLAGGSDPDAEPAAGDSAHSDDGTPAADTSREPGHLAGEVPEECSAEHPGDEADPRAGGDTSAATSEDSGSAVGGQVHVVEVPHAVAALAALAVYDPSAPAAQTAESMRATAAAMQWGRVVRRRGHTRARGGRRSAIRLVDDLLAQTPGAELVTLLVGAPGGEETAEAVVAHLRSAHPEMEIERVDAPAEAGEELLAIGVS